MDFMDVHIIHITYYILPDMKTYPWYVFDWFSYVKIYRGYNFAGRCIFDCYTANATSCDVVMWLVMWCDCCNVTKYQSCNLGYNYVLHTGQSPVQTVPACPVQIRAHHHKHLHLWSIVVTQARKYMYPWSRFGIISDKDEFMINSKTSASTEHNDSYLPYLIFVKIRHARFTSLYIGGSRGASLRDQILSFSHTFLPKSTHIRGPHPPNGSMPPLREILDPPLPVDSN